QPRIVPLANRMRLLAQDFLHGPAFGELIHQFVEVTYFSHQRILDLLDANAADDAGDLADVGVERRRLAEERLEALLLFDLRRERLGAVASQPADDFVQLRLRAALFLRLL